MECRSVPLRIHPSVSHWVLLVMDVYTRRLIGFGVERANIDGVSVCRMFNRAIAGQRLPKHVSTDHDPLFRFHRWLANLRVLEIEEVKSVPYAPVSHPFIERLIGTVRREYLDQVFFWNAIDLARKLAEFRDYYNAHRVHRSLAGTTPAQRAGASSLLLPRLIPRLAAALPRPVSDSDRRLNGIRHPQDMAKNVKTGIQVVGGGRKGHPIRWDTGGEGEEMDRDAKVR